MAEKHLYVAHVRGTVKGGVDTALAPKTLIVGPNGAGKSRVVNAIELAVSGYASDVVGRPQMRSGSDLIALAPDGEPLHAVATLSDERSASFRVCHCFLSNSVRDLGGWPWETVDRIWLCRR